MGSQVCVEIPRLLWSRLQPFNRIKQLIRFVIPWTSLPHKTTVEISQQVRHVWFILLPVMRVVQSLPIWNP